MSSCKRRKKSAKKCCSASAELRNQGNAIFVTATTDLCPTLQTARLKSALTCYKKSYDAAVNDEESASAAKNIAVTSWKVVGVEVKQSLHPDWTVVKQSYHEALKHYCMAYRKGEVQKRRRLVKSQEWLDHILMSSQSCWEEMNNLTVVVPKSTRPHYMQALRDSLEFIPTKDLQADCHMELAAYHFRQGLAYNNKADYIRGLSELKECYYPMYEAQRLGAGVERIQTDVRVLEEDLFMNTCLAESMKSRVTGDSLFNEILKEQETLNVDMIWEVIDWYKDSILKVRNVDIKQEAISLTKIGLVYDKVLKIKFRAQAYLKKSVELAQSITPFNVMKEDWYRECVAVLERYQQDVVQTEEKEQDVKKAAVRESLKTEFADLQKHVCDDYRSFLTYVYKTYPPLNPNYKLDMTMKPNEDSDGLKYRLLQKAVIHYHPDRIREEVHGLKLKVLNEEITKYLTNRYEQIKGVKTSKLPDVKTDGDNDGDSFGGEDDCSDTSSDGSGSDWETIEEEECSDFDGSDSDPEVYGFDDYGDSDCSKDEDMFDLDGSDCSEDMSDLDSNQNDDELPDLNVQPDGEFSCFERCKTKTKPVNKSNSCEEMSDFDGFEADDSLPDLI